MKGRKLFKPTSAMVLAAGLGTRMRPLTDRRPKPLIKIAGKALIDHVLDGLAGAGLQRAVINAHYLADMLIDHVSTRQKPEIIISDERAELLDTGGGIFKALPHLGTAPFYIANCDSIWPEGTSPLLSRLGQGWDDQRMDALLALVPAAASRGYNGSGDFAMDPAGRLSRRVEGGLAPFVYTGTAILSPDLFRTAPPGRFSLNLLFDEAIAHGRLYGLRFDGTWMHVGSPQAVETAEQAMVTSGLVEHSML